MQLLLPITGATELDDWPGGIAQQLQVAAPYVQELVQQISGQTTDTRVIDKTDAVALCTGKVSTYLSCTDESDVYRAEGLSIES